MKKLFLFFIAFGFYQMYAQDTISLSKIIEKLNNTTYKFKQPKELKNYININNNNRVPLFKIDSIENYTIYYVLDQSFLDSLNNKHKSISCGYNIIIFSKNFSNGVLFSFTRSHEINKKKNKISLKFNSEQSLMLPYSLLINNTFNIKSLMLLSWLDEIPSEDLIPFSLIEFQLYKDPCSRKNISMEQNFYTMNLEKFFKVINSKVNYNTNENCEPIFDLKFIRISPYAL
jgi:hypothetical protein